MIARTASLLGGALPFPFGHLPLVVYDWSRRRVHYTFDGKTVLQAASLDEFLDALGGRPHRIAAEATFESWEDEARNHFLERCRAEGMEFRVFRPAQTARARAKSGRKKSDENDARTIWEIANTRWQHLMVPHPHDPAWEAFRSAVNADLVRLRSESSAKELAQPAVDVLGPYADLPDWVKPAFGNGRNYDAWTALYTIHHAAMHTRSVRDCDLLIGMWQNGYPSVHRSNMHHHWFRHRSKKMSKATLRRATRWAFARIKASSTRPAPPAPADYLDRA